MPSLIDLDSSKHNQESPFGVTSTPDLHSNNNKQEPDTPGKQEYLFPRL